MDEAPRERRVVVNRVSLAVYEWPGEGTPILFAHANGFHGRCWGPVVERLPARRRIAFDQRGHGQSDKPAPPYSWPDFGADLAALAQALGLRGAVGVGHSLGGYATTLAAALAPECFAALLLIDPVILSPESYQGRMPGVHGVARRRNHWSSPRAFYERLHTHHPFSHWEPAALQAYCDHGLIRNPAGHDYILACPPAVEAGIYHSATEHPIYDAIATIQIPVTVVRGHPYELNPVDNFAASPTVPTLAASFARGRDLHLTEHTHFIPMENSALVAGLIEELLTAVGQAHCR